MAVTQVTSTVNSSLEPNTQEINTLKVRMTEQEELLSSKVPAITSTTARQTVVEGKENVLEGQFGSLVINAGSSNAEIVAGRTSVVTGQTFDTMGHRVDGVDAQLADNAISPENFIGTDIQKVQQAVDYAIANKKAVKVSREYNLTGGSININLAVYGSGPLNVIGAGGSFKKLDVGYMFTASNGRKDNSVNFSYVTFTGDQTLGMYVLDGSKIIGTQFINCQLRGINTLVYSTTYIQSIRLYGCTHFTSAINTYLIDTPSSYDVDIMNNRFEAGQGGVYRCKSDVVSLGYDNKKVRIKHNVIEGRRTPTIVFGTVHGLTIEDNYFEENYGSPILGVSTPNGFEPSALVINNNMFYKGTSPGDNAIDLTAIPSTASPKGIECRNNITDYDYLIVGTIFTARVDTSGSLATVSVIKDKLGGLSVYEMDRKFNRFVNDFMVNTINYNGWTTSGTNGGTLLSQAGNSVHPGIVCMKCTTGVGSGYRVTTDYLALTLYSEEKCTGIFQINNPTGTMTRYGFMDTVDYLSVPSHGSFFEINGLSLIGKNVAASVESPTAAYNLTANTWYRFVIEIVGINIVFKVYADNSDTVLFSGTVTTNLPTVSLANALIAYTTGTTSQDLVTLDYMDLLIPYSRMV